MELSKIEELAIYQALYSKIADTISTKATDNLRSEVDGAIIDQYLKTGAKSFDIRLGAGKVGTISVRMSKAKTQEVLKNVNTADFEHWLYQTCTSYTTKIVSFIEIHEQEFLKWWLEETGELPDGIERDVITTEEQPVGTTLRVDPQKVADFFHTHQLQGDVTRILEGGFNE